MSKQLAIFKEKHDFLIFFCIFFLICQRWSLNFLLCEQALSQSKKLFQPDALSQTFKTEIPEQTATTQITGFLRSSITNTSINQHHLPQCSCIQTEWKILKRGQNEIAEFANSIDPYEAVHHELPHLSIYTICALFSEFLNSQHDIA